MLTATAEAPVETKTGTKPLETFRIRNISVSVFPQTATKDGKEYTFLTVSPSRSYRAGEERKYSTSFSRDDLPVVNELLKRAWNFVNDYEQDQRQKTADVE